MSSSSFSPHHVGLAFGGFLGLWHFAWSLLVAIGLAQPLLDLIFRFHMIQPPYTVMPFSLTMAVSLILFTCVFGYVIGYALTLVWNMVQKRVA